MATETTHQRVYVQGLLPSVTEADLTSLLGRFGALSSPVTVSFLGARAHLGLAPALVASRSARGANKRGRTQLPCAS